MRRRRRTERKERHGVAAVEIAVVLPLLVYITLATVESCNAIYLRQSATIAAFEGARVAIVPQADIVNVGAQIDQILADHRVQGATVIVNPADLSTMVPGDWVQVDVTVPLDGNRFLPSWILGNRDIHVTAEMMCEY